MGHQLLLCANIPHSKYVQTVSTLQALTGLLKPQQISTYTIITKPHNVFKPKVEAGKVNQIEQYYMKCTTTWDDDAAQALDLSQPIVNGKPEVKVDRLFMGEKVKQWTFHIADIPTAGKNAVLAQNFYESTMVHHHSKGSRAAPKVKGSAQTDTKTHAKTATKTENTVGLDTDEKATRPVNTSESAASRSSEHPNTKGYTAAQTNSAKTDLDLISLELIGGDEDVMVVDGPSCMDKEKQPAPEPEREAPEPKDSFLQFLEDLGYDVINQFWLKGIRFFYGDIVIEIFKVLIRDDNDQAKSEDDPRIPLKLLDDSNTFQIKTYSTFPKGTNVDLISKGTKELTNLKATLLNLFELEVPDRMFMDFRVTRVT